MQDNPQKFFKSGFRVNGSLHFEFIEHADLHSYLYINGCMTDILLPRSMNNFGTVNFPTNIKELFDIREHIRYGKSKYNQKLITDLFEEGFAQYLI